MSEETHAEKSASGAHRWMACEGSIVLEAGEPNPDSEYAAEGNLYHALMARCLETGDEPNKYLMLGDEIVPLDMRQVAQEALDRTRQQAKGRYLLTEQKLDLESITGEKGAKGTADVVIIGEDYVQVIDHKYGMGVRVSAKDNPQTRIYGLAALRQFDVLGDYKKVRLGIDQPRLEHYDEEELTIEEINTFAQEVKQAVKRVEEATRSNSLDGYLHPGITQCKFCRARAKCPALAKVVSDATGADFEDETQKELIEPINIGAAMDKADLIETWIKGVRAKAEAELFAGHPVAGYKLVEGKLGNRKWINEDDVIALAKTAKLTDDELYNQSPRSPAQMEKKLKGKPKIWEKMQKLYTQKPGEPSVARATDPRPAYNPKHGDDFEDLTIPETLKRKRA